MENLDRHGVVRNCKLRIELPFPLPTWNRMLAMHHWERKALRDSLHRLVFMSTQYAEDSQTLTVSPQKQLLMDSYVAEYLKMIRPPTSKKLPTRSKKAKLRKR